MTLSIYGITYRVPKYAELSIDSIVKNASQEIEFTVVDSLSGKSPEIRDRILKPRVDSGKISRALFPNTNCRGYGLVESFYRFPPKDEDFFIFTDLDLIVPEGCDWISKVREAMKEYKLCGFSLSRENYVPPNGGHLEVGFGYWLMGIRTDFFMEYCPRGENLLDTEWRGAAGPSSYQIPDRLYHLGWDLYKDDPAYFEEKRKRIDYKASPGLTNYEVYEKLE